MVIKTRHAQDISKICLFLILISTGITMLKENAIPLLKINNIESIMDNFITFINIIIMVGAIICACFVLKQTLFLVGVLSLEIVIIAVLDISKFSFAISHIKQILIVILASYIISSVKNSPEDIYSIFMKSAYVLFICCLIATLIFAVTVKKIYSMPYANCVVFPAIVFLNDGIQKRKLYEILLSILCAGLIIIYGSRGTLVIYAAFVLCKLTFLRKHLKRGLLEHLRIEKKLLMKVYFCILACLVFVALKSRSIIGYLLKNSRTLELFSSGTILKSSGRVEYFWLPIIKGIKSNWLLGNGIYSDRLYLYELFLNEGINDATLNGSYAHNFFLEIIYQLGIIRASIVIIIILAIFLYTVKNVQNNRYSKDIFYLLLCMNIMLLYSSSYLTWDFFWILLGFSIKTIEERGKKQNEKKVVR